MKSVGEAMAIGRTFKESLQKCLRSLEIGRSGLGGDGKPWRIVPFNDSLSVAPTTPSGATSSEYAAPDGAWVFYQHSATNMPCRRR